MEASGSSKVTVEYHDPSGIFPLISRDITGRLPLRNLNWQSPSRPLRQIRSLHVDFVPDQATQNTLRPPPTSRTTDETSDAGTKPNSSLDIVRSGRDPKKDAAAAVKERRHQIPGLKTSPYLKLYVLRCDDKEVYKETERKRIREWIRENATSDGKRDNHDAFEWLVLHVVIPDTVSASEPRWRETSSSRDSDELKERPKSSAKWPGKSTRTVFDRLRADFNESSKTSPDRIAQIRLQKNDVSPDLLPTPAVASTLGETAQERENAWNDLVTKFKMLILVPFDLRVRQYEADIAQQEARRSLPGWNFCTFFIHKEGLAKALESIGLVEDALAIYDELALGLETVVRDIASGQASGTATTFEAWTDDIEERIVGKEGTGGAANGETHEDAYSDLFNKDYREKIVRSSISVFDFFCYLFSRQKTLILRLANTRASQAALGGTGKDVGEDLVLISEVCWRASSFIHNNARTLRQDLLNGPSAANFKQAAIESLVCSWTYTVADQVLKETAASALDSSSAEARPGTPNGTNSRRPVDFSFGMGANPYPQRSSSLPKPGRKFQLPDLRPRTSTPADSGSTNFGASNSSFVTELTPRSNIPGQPELATYRAELLIVQRNMLEQLAERRGWRVGWAAAKYALPKMGDVELDDAATDEKTTAGPKNHVAVSSLLAPVLAAALESDANFHANFEYLSDLTMRHYAVATQTKTVQAVLAELAMLKCQQGDWETAATYFQHVLPALSSDSWSLMDAEIRRAYARCMKVLGKKDEYVKTSLDLLAKTCGRVMEKKLPRIGHEALPDYALPDHSGLFAEVVEYSRALASDVTRPMDQYFSDIRLESEIMHRDQQDGFTLRLHFRHLLDDEIKVGEISARLVALGDANQEIWLHCPRAMDLTPGMKRFDLEASTVAFGAFLIDRVVLKAGKLRFVHEMQPKPEVPRLMIADTELTSAVNALTTAHRRPFTFLYPAAEAFDIEVSLSRQMSINRPRYLELKLAAGWNELECVDIKLRPMSAGLRLHVGDSRLEEIIRREGESITTPGQLCLGGLEAGKTALVRVPYTLEQPQHSISVRFEAQYRTSKGPFTFLHSVRLPSELPLDVDVDDVFHLDALYSTFTVQSTNQMPVSIKGATLEDSSVYAVEAPPRLALPIVVFDKQPAKLAYKITRKQECVGGKLSKKEAALALHIRYQAMEELVATTTRKTFADSLQQSPFAALSRLLLPLLTEHSGQSLTAADMALVALLHVAKVPSFDELGWAEIIRTLPKVVQPELTEWLTSWHAKHTRLALEPQSEGTVSDRCISIVVDVPTVDFVHGASLTLAAPLIPPHPRSGPRILPLGQAIKAQLSIQHTDIWSTKKVYGILPSNKKDEGGDSNTFVFDIHAESDTWLIGGQRRAHFTMPISPAATTERSYDIVLVPLRLGLCALPTVDVQGEVPFDTTADGAPPPPPLQQSSIRPAPVSCETHYRSAGQVVHVIRELRTARAHIMEEYASAAPLSPPAPASLAGSSVAAVTGSVTSG